MLALSATLSLSLPLAAAPLAPNCKDQCTVKIFVPAGCGSGIKVAPDPIVVAPGATVTITWRIEGTKWEFDEKDGIYIHYAGETFAKDNKASGKGSFKFKNTNKKSQAYKYDVNLVDAKDPEKKKCTLDPTVVNQ